MPERIPLTPEQIASICSDPWVTIEHDARHPHAGFDHLKNRVDTPRAPRLQKPEIIDHA